MDMIRSTCLSLVEEGALHHLESGKSMKEMMIVIDE